MLLPDFFLIGAPKCGTTSLASWLAGHPRIFMPALKEPHFFNTDDRQGIATRAAYEALFAGAGPAHLAVGEASVWYLSSAVAVANILRVRPDARFIVMLRNPVEMAPALHAEMVLSGHEDLADFAAAWAAQAARRAGRRLPALSWARRRLLYGEACALGAQMRRLLSQADPARVLPILLEDVARAPRREYLRALGFLGVADDGRAAFPAYNAARRLLHPRLTRALFLAIQLKRRAGIDIQTRLWRLLERINVAAAPRRPLAPALGAELAAYFRDDILLLGEILRRDLRHWLPEGTPPRAAARDAA